MVGNISSQSRQLKMNFKISIFHILENDEEQVRHEFSVNMIAVVELLYRSPMIRINFDQNLLNPVR